ncbi:MAG: NUDIX domain-containing protein [Anaerolineales bacterium]|nr:NUDIX domain-containing protein [Anaerolineales bacterium]
MKSLLRLWRIMPLWMHFLAAKLVRPRFRAGVAAIIFDEQGRVLLFKHTYRKFEWGLPAGGLEYHEQPINAIVREFFEETGIKIQVERLLTATSAREDSQISMIYLCKVIDGEFKESHEISEMKYFSVNELPDRMLFAEKELIKWVLKDIKEI